MNSNESNNNNKSFKDRLATQLYEDMAYMEAGMWDEAYDSIISIFIQDLDKAILKIRNHLPHVSSPEEYWMDQGSIHALRELKEQLNSGTL